MFVYINTHLHLYFCMYTYQNHEFILTPLIPIQHQLIHSNFFSPSIYLTTMCTSEKTDSYHPISTCLINPSAHKQPPVIAPSPSVGVLLTLHWTAALPRYLLHLAWAPVPQDGPPGWGRLRGHLPLPHLTLTSVPGGLPSWMPPPTWISAPTLVLLSPTPLPYYM